MKKTLLCFILLFTNYFYAQLTASASLLKPIDCLSNAEVSITASGGQLPYEYALNKDPYQSSNIFKNLTAGDYTIAVKDALNSIRYTDITIADFQVLSAAVTAANSSTIADNDGRITVAAVGGIKPYNYTLTNNVGLALGSAQVSNAFTGLKAGTYGIQVQDARNCILSQTNISILNKPNALSASVAIVPITCLTDLANITVTASGGTAPYQYSLNNGNNYISSGGFSALEPGTYTIKIRDADNNETTVTAVVSPMNSPTVTLTATTIRCKGDNTGEITATAIGGKAPYLYTSNGNTFTNNPVFTNLRVGTYQIGIKDANGCTNVAIITLNEPAEGLSATAFAVNDQSIIVNAKGGTGPYLYYLQNNMGVVVAGPQDNGVFVRLPLGSYSAQVTDVNGCGLIQGPINVIPATALLATADVLAVNCSNSGKITVNASGGLSPYQYSFDGGNNYSSRNFINSNVSKSYDIRVRDYQNTTISLTAVITGGDALSFNTTSANVACKGDSSGWISIKGIGGKAPYTFSLNEASYVAADADDSKLFSNLFIGTHHIAVKDANGCILGGNVVISEPTAAVTAIFTVKNQTITVNAAGGNGDFRYAISPNLDVFSEKNSFPALVPGTYTIIVQDANGCSVIADILVDPSSPLIDDKDILTIEFNPGQTLGDLVVKGQNIKWYSNQNPLSGKTTKTSTEATLPLTTLLVDGTTYYASQTINGIESVQRLAVTAKLSGTLSTPDVVLPNFRFYPNPVQHTLIIDNASTIDEIEVVAVSGKSVLAKKINNTHSEIDLSNVSTGFYFLKVKAEGKVKTIKIVKK